MTGSVYFHRDPEKLFPKALGPEFNHRERRVLAAQLRRMRHGRQPTGPHYPMIFAINRLDDPQLAEGFVKEVMV